MSFALLDIIIIAFVAISILVGIFRGLVKEILSLASWVLAAFLAYRYGEQMATYISQFIKEPLLASAIGYVATFLLALIAFSIVGYLIGRLFNATGMSAVDRSLGSVFGAIRAAGILGIVILVGNIFNLDSQSWWQDSQLLGYFQPVADWIVAYLPDNMAEKLQHAPAATTL